MKKILKNRKVCKSFYNKKRGKNSKPLFELTRQSIDSKNQNNKTLIVGASFSGKTNHYVENCFTNSRLRYFYYPQINS